MKKKILVTGGAGYVGSKLISRLLSSNFNVTILDNLLFGGDHLLNYINHENFNFIKCDIRNLNEIKKIKFNDFEFIIHLASIVGYPACRADPETARITNINGTKNILGLLNKDQKIIFASTGSNYGKKSELVNENSKLEPLSLYAETKVINEKQIADHNNFLIYRFATAFGSSPRMRLDLLINDFAYKAVSEGYLVVYEKNHQRSFIHVDDMADSIVFGIKNFVKLKNDIYNVGDDQMNYSKEEICNLLKKKIKNLYVHFAEFDKDADQRNYIVSYKKINNIGFKATINIDKGINDLIKSFQLLNKNKSYKNI
jgi:nucleoside-diphosphate-sugar epimerase